MDYGSVIKGNGVLIYITTFMYHEILGTIENIMLSEGAVTKGLILYDSF